MSKKKSETTEDQPRKRRGAPPKAEALRRVGLSITLAKRKMESLDEIAAETGENKSRILEMGLDLLIKSR
jgi:hypothetical protein